MEEEINGNGGSRERQLGEKDEGFFGPEIGGIKKEIIGGIIMIGIASMWFIGGLWVGWFFWYPPILFLIRVYALIKGLVTGNINGDKQSPMT